MGNVIRNMETLKKRIKIINRSQKCCYRNEECPLWSYQRLDMDEERISALRDRSIETSHFEKQREKKKRRRKIKIKQQLRNTQELRTISKSVTYAQLQYL